MSGAQCWNSSTLLQHSIRSIHSPPTKCRLATAQWSWWCSCLHQQYRPLFPKIGCVESFQHFRWRSHERTPYTIQIWIQETKPNKLRQRHRLTTQAYHTLSRNMSQHLLWSWAVESSYALPSSAAKAPKNALLGSLRHSLQATIRQRVVRDVLQLSRSVQTSPDEFYFRLQKSSKVSVVFRGLACQILSDKFCLAGIEALASSKPTVNGCFGFLAPVGAYLSYLHCTPVWSHTMME